MGKSVNAVRLLGHVGRNPEVKTLQGGLLVANLSLATNERRKVNNAYQDHTEWHRITAFGKLAEIVRDYVKKGNQLYLEGKLRTQSWDDNGTTRYSTSIIAEDLTLLGAPQANGQSGPPVPPDEAYEDVPF